MEAYLASLNFPEILILILVGLLFFKEELSTWIKSKLGSKKEDPMTPETATVKMAEDMAHLRMHFNDDLTRILTEMQLDLKDASKQSVSFRETQLQQCGKLEEIRDAMRDILRNGIRIRN